MKKVFLALFLALTMIPVAAFADDASPFGAPPSLTPAQQQAFETFRRREDELHQQFRSQVLAALSADHRNAVANLIGQLAISSNPDPRAAISQIDSLLSQGEQQAILSAHNTFRQQAKALHEQLRSQMRGQVHGMPYSQNRPGMMQKPEHQPDAGEIVLHTLAHFEPMEMHGLAPHR
ncbi:MAG: hypothetical protein JO092_07775 [Candidatus Eremiobacteraeota bacterium]|nr:hypothetical protein [Candidatus Eremiobacteraeota bacterium]MBV8374245.1 hypothetical protein [Candidatus Eremiobacteraeota bacterium]